MNCFSVFQSKIPNLKFISFILILINCRNQLIIITDWQKVDTKAFVPHNIRISMRFLIQTAHHRKKGGFIAMKTAPSMKADIRFTICFPSSDGK